MESALAELLLATAGKSRREWLRSENPWSSRNLRPLKAVVVHLLVRGFPESVVYGVGVGKLCAVASAGTDGPMVPSVTALVLVHEGRKWCAPHTSVFTQSSLYGSIRPRLKLLMGWMLGRARLSVEACLCHRLSCGMARPHFDLQSQGSPSCQPDANRMC